jgi:predicted DNA-binding transcriptional regulator AlpA
MTGKRVLRKREVLERLGIRKTTLYESFIKTGRLRFVED